MAEPIKAIWLDSAGQDPKKRSDLEVSIRNCGHVLRILKEIIEREEKTILSQERSASDFDTPNWAEKQAFRNGQLNNLNKLKDLLSFL